MTRVGPIARISLMSSTPPRLPSSLIGTVRMSGRSSSTSSSACTSEYASPTTSILGSSAQMALRPLMTTG